MGFALGCGCQCVAICWCLAGMLIDASQALYPAMQEDIGTVRAFYESNLALTDSPNPNFRWGRIGAAQRCLGGAAPGLVT